MEKNHYGYGDLDYETDESRRLQSKKSIKELTESIRKYIWNFYTYPLRGDQKVKLDRYRDAIRDYSIAIRRYKRFKFETYRSAFVHRAYAKAQINDLKGACLDLRKAESNFWYVACPQDERKDNPLTNQEEEWSYRQMLNNL